MAWCHQATSHYLNQCWPRSSMPYGVTRPQWVKQIWPSLYMLGFLNVNETRTDRGAGNPTIPYIQSLCRAKLYLFMVISVPSLASSTTNDISLCFQGGRGTKRKENWISKQRSKQKLKHRVERAEQRLIQRLQSLASDSVHSGTSDPDSDYYQRSRGRGKAFEKTSWF